MGNNSSLTTGIVFFSLARRRREALRSFMKVNDNCFCFFLRSCPVFVSWPVDLEQGIGKRSLSSLIATNYVTT